MFDSGDVFLICRKWLPKKVVAKEFLKFQKEFSLLFNEKSVNNLQKDKYSILQSWNKTENFYTCLYKALIISSDYDKEMKELYYNEFGKECKTTQDIEWILTRIEFYRKKRVEELKKLEPEKEQEQQSFETIISNTESILGISIPRDMKLFQFSVKYKDAIKKIKQLEVKK